jgi:nicotinamide mononucleotide (NMN) deamidase PncC
MNGGVKVEGASRLAATLAQAGRELGHLDAANARVGADVATAARGRAPRSTGRLARSVTGRAGPGNSVEIVGTVVYAGVIHNGWPRHGIRANPFIADVVNSRTDQIVNQYRTETDKILSHVKGA